MNYDFNFPALNLDGTQSERTLGSLLSDFIGSETSKVADIVKLCHWYDQLIQKKPLELDPPDRDTLIKIISDSDRMGVFIKNQLLKKLKSE